MPVKTGLSVRGLNLESAVDVPAQSDIAAAKPVTFVVPVGSQPLSANSAYFVINTSTDHVLGNIGLAGTIVKATISSARVASLGAGSFSLYKATDGSTKTLITNTVDPEGVTANVASSFTMVTAASANVITAADVLFLRCTADNNTVTTDSSSVRVTVWVVPTDTAPTRGGATWGT